MDESEGRDSNPLVLFNGFNATHGEAEVAPITLSEFAARIRGLPAPGKQLQLQQAAVRDRDEPPLDTRDGYEKLDLAEAGWGLILPYGGDPEVEEALQPLIDHREAQAGRLTSRRFRVYRADEGYRPGEMASEFREGRGGVVGAVDPDRMPYYLLIAGSPERIPFGFQFQLDLRHAVGRVSFDTAEEYRRYAASVIDYEAAPERASRRELALFASRLAGDGVSEVLADYLIRELGRDLRRRPVDGWRVREVVGEEATKERLAELLGGDGHPDLVFSACHGVGFASGDLRLRDGQGGVVCQAPSPPWPYFTAADLPSTASPRGLISVLYGCYSGGVPEPREAPEILDAQRRRALGRPFVSRLPQRLLAHPSGGALAVLAHVGLAYGFSFWGVEGTPQLTTFQDLLRRLMEGCTVGWALELINLMCAQLSSEMWFLMDNEAHRGPAADKRLVRLFTAMHDAGRYLVLGDPACRLRLGETAR